MTAACLDCPLTEEQPYAFQTRAFAGWGNPEQHPKHPLATFMTVEESHPHRAETLLFRTVILQAIYEACGGDAEARFWLLNNSNDLTEVCDYAETSPRFIQSVTLQLLSGRVPMPDWRVWRYMWQPTLEAVR